MESGTRPVPQAPGEGNSGCLLGMGSSLPFPFARTAGCGSGREALLPVQRSWRVKLDSGVQAGRSCVVVVMATNWAAMPQPHCPSLLVCGWVGQVASWLPGISGGPDRMPFPPCASAPPATWKISPAAAVLGPTCAAWAAGSCSAGCGLMFRRGSLSTAWVWVIWPPSRTLWNSQWAGGVGVHQLLFAKYTPAVLVLFGDLRACLLLFLGCSFHLLSGILARLVSPLSFPQVCLSYF